MNQLKKMLLALAVVVSLGVIGANNAAAQVSCVANSVPTLVRTADITGLTGSIVLNCTIAGGAVSGPASITDTIQPAAAVITNSPAAGAVPTITVIPGPGTTMAGTGPPPVGTPVSAPCPAGGCVVAAAPASNTVTFPVPAVTACAPPAGSTVCTFSIAIGVAPAVPAAIASVGIRVNVFASGVVFPAQISALLTSSPAGIVAITNNILNVAIPQVGLGTTFTAGVAVAQCGAAKLGASPSTVAWTFAGGFTATNPTTGTALVAPSSVPVATVGEGFSSAFLVAGVGVGGNGEGADSSQGTRVLFTFNSLPSNVIIITPAIINNGAGGAGGTLTLALVAGADANGNGALAGLGGATALVATGTTVTYEVTTDSTAITESINVPFGLYTIGTPTPAGAATLSVGLAPVSTIGTPATTPIPRFGSAPITGAFVSVIPCLTNILFPWVANVAGYDTGFAISNTTTDVFGTASQSGTCVYNFFGANGPSGGTFTTPAFGGGNTDTRLLSAIAPGFSGYVIVVCNFQLGHGFEFISNGFGGGAITVGQGGPGLIILQPGVTGGVSRKGLAGIGPPFGEALGH